MKLTLVLAGLLLAFSVPAHAQSHPLTGGGPSNTTRATSGGGAGSGGSVGGSVSFNSPTHHPTTEFGMTAASGASSDFVPSTYLNYNEAVTAGQAALAKPQTIAEAAQANREAKAGESEYVIVQDKEGNLVSESRK